MACDEGGYNTQSGKGRSSYSLYLDDHALRVAGTFPTMDDLNAAVPRE
jgi:hypothetical protein